MTEIFGGYIIFTAKFIYSHPTFYISWFGICISILIKFIPIIHNEIRIRKERRNDFLTTIADQRTKLNVMESKGDEFFEQSVPVFRQAVNGIRNFLPTTQWDCLHAILQEYQDHNKSEFEDGKTRRIAESIAYIKGSKTPSEILLDFLDRFEKRIQKKKVNKK